MLFPSALSLPEVDTNVNPGTVLNDMLGMMVHMFSKQNENEYVKTQVVSNTDKFVQLEATVVFP